MFLCHIESGICQVAVNILYMTSQKSNISLLIYCIQSNIFAFKITSNQPHNHKKIMNTNIFDIWPKSYRSDLSWHVMRWCWALSTFAGNCLYLVSPLPVMGPKGADWHGTQEVSQQTVEHPDTLIQINTHCLSSALSCKCFFFRHSFKCLCCNLRMYSYK